VCKGNINKLFTTNKLVLCILLILLTWVYSTHLQCQTPPLHDWTMYHRIIAFQANECVTVPLNAILRVFVLVHHWFIFLLDCHFVIPIVIVSQALWNERSIKDAIKQV
jgi:hypothetical protein